MNINILPAYSHTKPQHNATQVLSGLPTTYSPWRSSSRWNAPIFRRAPQIAFWYMNAYRYILALHNACKWWSSQNGISWILQSWSIKYKCGWLESVQISIQPALPLWRKDVHVWKNGWVIWNLLHHTKKIEGTAQSDFSAFYLPQLFLYKVHALPSTGSTVGEWQTDNRWRKSPRLKRLKQHSPIQKNDHWQHISNRIQYMTTVLSATAITAVTTILSATAITAVTTILSATAITAVTTILSATAITAERRWKQIWPAKC